MKVSIIDPVGDKAGIDHYDILVLLGIHKAGNETILYSNFNFYHPDITYKRVFFNTGVSKISAILSNFKGFFIALSNAKKIKTDWLILHIFRGGLFDLFTFSLARLMGLRVLSIVHDIESLDTLAFPIIRKTIIGKLSNIRVVHNEFSKNKLLAETGNKIIRNTFVIPHVNFVELFSKYHSNSSAKNSLLNNEKIIHGLHPQLPSLIQQKVQVILFFGQIKKVKGLDILIEAISKCKSEFKLIIAGKLRDESWEKYSRLIKASGAGDKIISIIRHITDEERDVLFAMSNCIVLPYRIIYQSGVLLMAMSFPLPLIASDLPPNREIIESGKNGLLFESENPEDLADKIDFLLNHPTNAESMKQQGFLDVQSHFNNEKIGKQFSDILHQYA